jgi:HSP20 family molecular chaperone IbpA
LGCCLTPEHFYTTTHISLQSKQTSTEETKEKEKEGENTSIKKAGEKKVIERWNLRCDVEEKKEELIIKAKLPGLKKEEVKIEYDEKQGILSIYGEKKQEKEESKDNTPQGKNHCIKRTKIRII